MVYALLGAGMLLSYLLPWHVHPLRSLYHELSSITGLLLAFAALACLSFREKMKIQMPALIVFPGVMLLVLLLDVCSPHRTAWFDALIPAQYFILMDAAFILGATLTVTEQGREDFCLSIASVFMLAGLVSFVMQLIQVAGLDASPIVMYVPFTHTLGRPYANLAQPNQLALLFCFSLAAICLLRQKNNLSGPQAFVLAFCILIGIALTQSRIGWIIIPLFTFMLITQGKESSRNDKGAIVVLLALYFSIVFLLPLITASLGMAGGSVAEHVGGRSERKGLWLQAWSIAQSHPWRGVGWFGFGAEQVNIAADLPSSTYAEHAHNLILNFAAETGWPLTLIFSGAFLWWFWQTFMVARKNLALQFSTMCLLAALVHSMVEFPLWYAYILLPVAMLMGMQHQMRWQTNTIDVRPLFVLSMVAVAFATMALMTWDYQRVVSGFNVLRWEPTPSAAGLKKLQKPAFTLYPQFFDYFELMQIEPREGMSIEEIGYMEKWTPRFGFVHILNKLAEINVLNGEPKKAAREMTTLQKLHTEVYPEYYDYWHAKGALDPRYNAVFAHIPQRNAP